MRPRARKTAPSGTRRTLILMQPGTKVIVPDDDTGACVFMRPGDRHEGIEIEHPDGHTYMADVGLVQYPDGCVKPWVYSKIRAA